MDSVARIKRQRFWLLIGSGVAIALGLAGLRQMGEGEPQPVGLYVIYWVAATLLVGLIILLGYNQAIVFASLMQVLGRLSEVAGQKTGFDLVMVELQIPWNQLSACA